jgi:hypothetical protein
MKTINTLLSLGLALVVMGGCSDRKNVSPMPAISNEAKAGLNRPVNCGTARRDIGILEEERASTAKQIVSGVRSVFPIAAVVGLISGDYSDRVEVATGSYNDAIQAKIDHIKGACGLR